MPKLVGDQTIYDMDADSFAAHIPDFIALGAQVVGACCGSNPTHIAAVAAIVTR
jgi:5-methyltetrahydrofolate--homocysteine methyltransferase